MAMYWTRQIARSLLVVWLVSFTFYAAVVIPAGTSVSGAAQQGLVTERVTGVLNSIGLMAVVFGPLLLVQPAVPRWSWLLWLVVLACQLSLIPLRLRLGGMLDRELGVVREGTDFYLWHQVYLWLSIGQWLAVMLLVVCTRSDWQRRSNDR